MRFNLACFTAAVLAASVAAVPLDSTKTVLVHREACPAPAPAPAPTPVPAPAPAPQPQSSEVCTANSQPSCCESVQSSSNSQVLDLFSQLGIDHQKASDKGPVGLTCMVSLPSSQTSQNHLHGVNSKGRSLVNESDS